jgi:hypothetical protein
MKYFEDNVLNQTLHYTILCGLAYVWLGQFEYSIFPLAPMGVLAHRLRTLDRLLVVPSTQAKIVWRTCLQSYL